MKKYSHGELISQAMARRYRWSSPLILGKDDNAP